MYFSLSVLFMASLVSSFSEPLRCIPCTRAYTSNKFHVSKLLNDWCPKSNRTGSSDYAVRYRDLCSENRYFSASTFLYCMPCTSIQNEDMFEEACRGLLQLDYSRNDSIRDIQSNIVFPVNLTPCEPDENTDGLSNSFVMFNGRCEALLQQGSCPDGQWLIFDQELKCAPKKCQDFHEYEYMGSCFSYTSRDASCPGGELSIKLDGTIKCECTFGADPSTGKCINPSNSGSCGSDAQEFQLDDGTSICTPHLCANSFASYIEDEGMTEIMTDQGPQNVYQMRCWVHDASTNLYCNSDGVCKEIPSVCGAFATFTIVDCKPGFVKKDGVCIRPSFFKLSRAPTGSSNSHSCSSGLVYDKSIGRCVETLSIFSSFDFSKASSPGISLNILTFDILVALTFLIYK